MTSRSRGREFAVQLLYQKIFSGYETARVFDLFWNSMKTDSGTRTFSENLVIGILENRSQLDFEITGYLKNWSLERIAVIDRIILEIGFYELIQTQDVPWKVVIDEAIDLAKAFSTEKNAVFINGVLHAWATKNRELDS